MISDLLIDREIASLESEIFRYMKAGWPYVKEARLAVAHDPAIMDVWLDTKAGRIVVRREYETLRNEKIAGMPTEYLKEENAVGGTSEEPWLCLAFTRDKCGSLAETIQGLGGWNDKFIPPSPLAALLATSALGGAAGYGGGAVVSAFLPDTWDKKRLRRNAALAGAAIGAAPGALETFKSVLIGQPVLDGSHMPHPVRDAQKAAAFGDDSKTPFGNMATPYSTGPIIDAESFKKTVWRRPELNLPEKKMFSGAMSASQAIAGSPWITPMDVGRLAAGMGSGYASGLVVGKTLGYLTGMPKPMQDRITQTGMFAGVVKAALPLLFNF